MNERIWRTLAFATRGVSLSFAAYALFRILTHRAPLQFIVGAWVFVLVGLLAASLGVGVRAVWRLRSQPGADASDGRLFVIAGVIVWLGFVFCVHPFQRIWLESAWGLLPLVWFGLEAGRDWLVPRQVGVARALEFVAFSLCIALPATEVALRGSSALWHSPLLTRVGDAPRRLIDRFRLSPGLVRYGFASNSRGFYDEEFERRAEGQDLVVSIGDSFSVGSVPHAWHMSTVCERELGVAVANIGVAGIGPLEYARLVVDEGVRLDPSVVVINVFVGNDLSVADIERDRPDQLLRSIFEREQVLLWVLPRRLKRLGDERARGVGFSRSKAVGEELLDPDLVTTQFPWVADPQLEEPHLSEEAHLRLETQRALEICRGEPAALDLLFRALRTARQAAGEARFVVTLIPDEFQVDDELWRSISAANSGLQRDRAQALVRAWLEQEDIPYLDLLPVLRAVEPLEDGKRHLYHLRDTHFNARGNDVAGRALAAFLRPYLGGS